MGVPERAARVTRLLVDLDVDETCVVWDPDHEGHVANWWRAVTLALADSNVTHALILEDDAEPCRDFLVAARQLVQRYPARIMSFYSAREVPQVRPGVAQLIPYYHALSDVAVVYPRTWLEALRQDFRRQRQELASAQWQLGYGADEMRLKLRPQQQVWCVVPSLVQHGCPGESTLGHRLSRARAPVCLATSASALALDWSAA